MSRLDRQLDRLLRAAAAVSRSSEFALPFGFETRVVAGLRARRGDSEMTTVFRLLRRGLAFTSLLMLAAIAATYIELNRVSTDPWSMPNAVVWTASVQ